MMFSKNRKSIITKTIAVTLIAGTISFGGNIISSNAAEIATGIVKPCDFLNMRNGAGVSNTVVGKINTGDNVQIVDRNSNGWIKIKTANNVIGWVNGDFITEANGNSNRTTSQKVQNVLNLAYKQSGKPYKWGSNGPSSFDCSGFTSYVYRNSVGVNLPRVSRDQANAGKRVNRNELQAGDLVFFGSGKSISHVGIYVGDSKFIHSPQTGDVVKVSRMDTGNYSKRFISASRILN